MKYLILLLACSTVAGWASAQKISLKSDTIMAGKTPIGLFRKGKAKPWRYFVCNLNGNELLEIHNGRVDVGGKPGYVVNFLNDMLQGMIVKDAQFPMSFLNNLASFGLIKDGAVVPANEQRFIKAYPLPVGYTDVEQLIEF